MDSRTRLALAWIMPTTFLQTPMPLTVLSLDLRLQASASIGVRRFSTARTFSPRLMARPLHLPCLRHRGWPINYGLELKGGLKIRRREEFRTSPREQVPSTPSGALLAALAA